VRAVSHQRQYGSMTAAPLDQVIDALVSSWMHNTDWKSSAHLADPESKQAVDCIWITHHHWNWGSTLSLSIITQSNHRQLWCLHACSAPVDREGSQTLSVSAGRRWVQWLAKNKQNVYQALTLIMWQHCFTYQVFLVQSGNKMSEVAIPNLNW